MEIFLAELSEPLLSTKTHTGVVRFFRRRVENTFEGQIASLTAGHIN